MKQEEKEKIEEYWKKLMDIKGKCELNRITPEEFITYKFAATIHNKKAQEKFFEGLLEIRTILGTKELDNFNRKYGEEKQKNTKQRRASSGISSNVK